jgi:chemotaxis protein MotA
MDIATIIGIVSGFGLVIASIIVGGGLGAFINIPSILITVGGTIAATLIAFPLDKVLLSFKVVKNTVFFSLPTESDIISDVLRYTELYLKGGAKGLESEIEKSDYPFMSKGLELLVAGTKVEKVNQILQADINNLSERHKVGINIMNTMGAFAPALGMIGTLIGLVQMLQTLEDPSTIGAGMAVALLTTFYGAIMSNLLFLPMATKLKERSTQEKNLRILIKDGIIAIGSREGKRFVSDHMITYLSQGDRDKVAV